MQGSEIGGKTVVRPYLGLGLMMTLLDWGLHGGGRMGKGSGVWLGGEGEGVGPNMPTKGDS